MTWLGQKPEPETARTNSPVPSPMPSAPVQAAPIAPAVPEYRAPAAPQHTTASIGKSLHVKGELSGNEDLAIEGKVEGKITLNGCHVTVGQTGRVSAEIQAKSVVVSGLVHGNITAADMVEVSATGTMMGDIRAPRVKLVDGSKFKGSIDMDAKPAGATGASRSPQTESPAMAAAGKA